MTSFVAHLVLGLVVLAASHQTLVGGVVGQFRMLVIHNNDLHARFVETDAYSASCPPDFVKENKCFGGFARVKQAINDAAAEAKARGIPSIYLNAGDTFQGTPYYTMFKWEIVAPLIDSLGPDVMSLGNHEFDDGIDNLVEYLKRVKTPVVACNLNLTTEPRLNLPNLTPSIVLDIDGRKIGVIGYLTPDTMSIANTENLEIFDEIPYIRAEAKRLKEEGVNIIIALGHSGFRRDIEIAQQIPEISMIVGGHSHTLLYTPKDKQPSVERVEECYPFIVTHESGKIVPIVQAYAYSKYLGKLWVTFDDNGDVTSAEGDSQLLDSSVGKDSSMQKTVEPWETRVGEKLRVVKGYTRSFIDKADFMAGQYESTGANLITDAISDLAIRKNNGTSTAWTNTPVALSIHGAIRSRIDNKKNGGVVTVEDLLTLSPFETRMYRIRYPGSTLIAALEKSVAYTDMSYLPYFLIFSGIKVVYNIAKPIGKRVEYAEILCENCLTPRYESLQPDQTYTVVISEFLKNGGDKFDMFQTGFSNITKLDFTDTEAVLAYFENHRVVYPKLDGRIQVKGMGSSASTANISAYMFLLVLLSIISLHKVL